MEKQKHFYSVFSILYENIIVGETTGKREDFYRLIFNDLYKEVGYEYVDNDGIRKVTSGNMPIHRKVSKRLYSFDGFERLRNSIEEGVLPLVRNIDDIIDGFLDVLNKDEFIPQDDKRVLLSDVDTKDEFKFSRFITACMVYLDYSDYMVNKGKDGRLNISFMRLGESQPPAKYPIYITEVPSSVDEVIGREEEIIALEDIVIKRKRNCVVSSVGGLGKTELIKKFLHGVYSAETTDSDIDAIAWISYDNGDLRFSLKQALKLKCDIEDVWMQVQALSERYGKRLLIVIDNVEKGDDEYLSKIGTLPSIILVTSRRRDLVGFDDELLLQPLSVDNCRRLFYKNYEFEERDNEILNDIIELTAKLTILIVMLAKVASLEEFSLRELYDNLKEKGFKLSEEDVSVRHERLEKDKSIIEQICILFSLMNISEKEQKLLACISIIPNLEFDFGKAKKWFGIRKNSDLMKLYKMGMIEEVTVNKKHIYWMHSVIAASVREQKKAVIYDLSRTFVTILSEELDYESTSGREYEKTYLIPFSWSVADIMEDHWNDEKDVVFLENLFHICFACSHYSLCARLIDLILRIQKAGDIFDYNDIANSLRNKVDLLLQFDKAGEAEKLLADIEELFDKNNASDEERNILKYQYAVMYQVKGQFEKSKLYYQQCIDEAESTDYEYSNRDKATAYANMGRMLTDSGDYTEAHDYLRKAIELHGEDEDDADIMICYCTLAAVCTELMQIGLGTTYVEEAVSCFEKVIKFREQKLGMHHADTAVAYHDYAFFWYVLGVYDRALKYNEMAYDIEYELFAKHSITRLRSLNTKALILFEDNQQEEALGIFEEIIADCESMNADYIVDLADFEYNYAISLADLEYYDRAKEMYEKCIDIWKGLSEEGFRKLAEAYLGYANILLMEGNIKAAKTNYVLAKNHITEDFYLMADVMDNIALCSMAMDDVDSSAREFAELVQLLIEFNAYDEETKLNLCNNLAEVIKADEDIQKNIKPKLLLCLKDDDASLKYINDYFSEIKENLAQNVEQTYGCLSRII